MDTANCQGNLSKCMGVRVLANLPWTSIPSIHATETNRWEICLSMREQNEPRNCVEYTQRVFTKRRNCVNIAKCLVQNKLLFYVENGHDIN